MTENHLYLAHCGFYDTAIGDGVYEIHTNFFVCANSFDDAKLKTKQLPKFKEKRMHIDGLQEIQMVDGYKITVEYDGTSKSQTIIPNNRYRQLARKTTEATQ